MGLSLCLPSLAFDNLNNKKNSAESVIIALQLGAITCDKDDLFAKAMTLIGKPKRVDFLNLRSGVDQNLVEKLVRCFG